MCYEFQMQLPGKSDNNRLTATTTNHAMAASVNINEIKCCTVWMCNMSCTKSSSVKCVHTECPACLSVCFCTKTLIASRSAGVWTDWRKWCCSFFENNPAYSSIVHIHFILFGVTEVWWSWDSKNGKWQGKHPARVTSPSKGHETAYEWPIFKDPQLPWKRTGFGRKDKGRRR